MKITDILSAEAICPDMQATDKKGAIEELVDVLIKAGELDKKIRNKVIEVLLAREALGSTAIGQGIAIPHGKCECIKKLTAAFGVSKKGVDFDSLDGEPVYLVFLLVAPIDSAGPHLKALARISRLLKDRYFRESLKSAPDAATIHRLIADEDARTA